MDKVLDGLIGKSCPVYLDDSIIYGKTFEETSDWWWNIYKNTIYWPKLENVSSLRRA